MKPYQNVYHLSVVGVFGSGGEAGNGAYHSIIKSVIILKLKKLKFDLILSQT